MNKREPHSVMPSATVRDLAAHASVSIGTVSRVLNRKPGVRPNSEERVLRAMEALGYRVSRRRASAQGNPNSGSRPRSGLIGLFMVTQSHEWAQHPLFLSYQQGVHRACDEASRLYGSTAFHPITEFSDQRDNALSLLRDQKLDGLVIKGNPSEWFASLPLSVPMVALNSHEAHLQVDQVRCDDHQAGFEVTSRLWELGHRRIAFVTRDGQHSMLILRLQGYEAYMRMQRAHAPELSYVTAEIADRSDPMSVPPNCDSAVDRWWSMPAAERPTAIIAANDWTAAGLYRTLAERSIRVPDDVSVVGFDNSPGLCDGLVPALSSYETPIEQAAFVGTTLLIEKIVGGGSAASPLMHLVRGRLIERASLRKIDPLSA